LDEFEEMEEFFLEDEEGVFEVVEEELSVHHAEEVGLEVDQFVVALEDIAGFEVL
jgi:hypothetical protein